MADAEEVPTCLVLGAGVQSLTCALCLHARGWSVVVLAAGRRAETTSWGAGAIWEYPPFRIEPKESAKRRVCISRSPFEVLATAPSSSKECGVRLLRSYYCFRDAEQGRKDFEAASDPPDAAPELREGLPPLGALRPGSPHQYAFSYRAPVICMARYLTWLEEKLAELGVQFVVNCLGLGAGEVFQVYIRAPALEAELGIGHISDEDHPDGVTYMVSQLDGVAREPEECGSWFGLRPEREGGVRLEFERHALIGPVVHNYGHGGSGVVTSWGCAGEVTELASQAAADAGLVLDLAVAAAGGRHTLAAMLPDSRAAVKVCKYAISHHRNNPHSVNTWVFRGQSYGGGLPLSEFNKVVPPGWRPGIPGYPIKLFFERLKLWYRVTDNAEAQLGVLVAGRLQGAPQKIALRLRLPRPVAAGGGYDIGDEALIRLSQEQLIDAATNTIVQEYIPSGLQFLCQALRAIYGLQDQDRATVALDSFYEFKRGHLGLAEFAQEFDHRYESAEDEAGLQMNDTGKTYFFLRGSGLGDKIIEDIKLQMRGDMSRYQEIRTLVLKLARANDKDKETLNMYQDQTDFHYKLNLDETTATTTAVGMIQRYDEDWYGDDGWQDEVYHGDFPLEEWTWPASAPDSSTVSTAETTLLDVDASYWKGQTKGKGKGFGAKGKGPSGGSASGIGCTTCGSRWHSSLDCPLNDPSKGDQGKGKGGKDYHYENFWKGKGKGKKGGKSKGFGKGWSKGFGKYRPSFGSGKGYGKYSGGYGKSYGKGYGKGKFKGGYGGFRYSSPYNFTAFQGHEVPEAPERAPTIAFKADGSGTQYYDFDAEKPSSSTRPATPQSRAEPMIDTAGNLGYNDGYGELDTAPAPMPDVRVNSLSFLVGTCSSAFPTDHEDWSSLYHSVRGVKRHGLLIDPGAASGLIGSDTLKEYRDEILLPQGVDIICRPTTQNVSGISGKPEPALSRVTMPIFPGIKSSTFTADVIGKQGSKCPALLPNPSMRAANMGLLTNFFENSDGMLIVHDNGKRLLYRCLLTESGHYILPTDNVKNNNNNVDEKATRKASAFYDAVLRDAKQQWSDISAVYLAVDKAADCAPPSTRSTEWKQPVVNPLDIKPSFDLTRVFNWPLRRVRYGYWKLAYEEYATGHETSPYLPLTQFWAVGDTTSGTRAYSSQVFAQLQDQLARREAEYIPKLPSLADLDDGFLGDPSTAFTQGSVGDREDVAEEWLVSLDLLAKDLGLRVYTLLRGASLEDDYRSVARLTPWLSRTFHIEAARFVSPDHRGNGAQGPHQVHCLFPSSRLAAKFTGEHGVVVSWCTRQRLRDMFKAVGGWWLGLDPKGHIIVPVSASVLNLFRSGDSELFPWDADIDANFIADHPLVLGSLLEEHVETLRELGYTYILRGDRVVFRTLSDSARMDVWISGPQEVKLFDIRARLCGVRVNFFRDQIEGTVWYYRPGEKIYGNTKGKLLNCRSEAVLELAKMAASSRIASSTSKCDGTYPDALEASQLRLQLTASDPSCQQDKEPGAARATGSQLPSALAILRQGIGLTTDLYDLTVVNAIRPEFEECYGVLSPWENGALSSAASAGAILGQLSFGHLADRVGRRAAFIATASLMCVASLGAAAAVPMGNFSAAQVMMCWRFLLGVGIGGEYPISGSVTAEGANSETSALHMAMLSLCFLAGQVLSSSVVLICLYAKLPAQVTWRLAIGFGAVLALVGAVLRARTMQESSAWLAARASSSRQRPRLDLRGVMRPLAGTLLNWMVYDIISYGSGSYTTSLFPASTRIGTLWNVLLIVALSVPGYLFTLCIGRFGRRNFQLVGFFVMGLCFLAMSVTYGRGGSMSVQVFIFGLQKSFDAFGPGATTFIIPAEIFPTAVRASCHGLSAAGGKLGAFIGIFLLPQAKEAFGYPVVLAGCGILCFLGVVLTLRLTPPYDAGTLRRIEALSAEPRLDLSKLSGVLWAREVAHPREVQITTTAPGECVVRL
ncbi:unnamed protein product [Polarella glacialis]|uniref:Major facilitator superfamily (MFS) profile domain-containing protein n=1 Tax=Polarella glacialis TaxID=89957 RepID=A0A813GKT8_POLGL|nr:unnamed protein product [Polarella glacialis]